MVFGGVDRSTATLLVFVIVAVCCVGESLQKTSRAETSAESRVKNKSVPVHRCFCEVR